MAQFRVFWGNPGSGAAGPVTHSTSGALAGSGASIAGTAARVAAPVTHDTSGALAGDGAVVAGIARGPQPDADSFGGGWANIAWPRKRKPTKRELTEEAIPLEALPAADVAALPAPVAKKARKAGSIKLGALLGKAQVAEMSALDLEFALQRIKRKKRQQEDEMLLLM